MTEKWDGNLTTGEAIIIWTDSLFKARKFKDKNGNVKEGAKAMHSCTLLFKPDSEAAQEVLSKVSECHKHFYSEMDFSELKTDFLADGDKKADKVKRKSDGNDKQKYLRGYLVVAVNTGEDSPPEMIDMAGDDLLPNQLKGGEVVRAAINVVPYDVNGEGIKAYLNAIMLVSSVGETHPDFGKLERISGGGRSAREAFKDYIGKKKTSNPAGGIDLGALGGGGSDD